MVPPNNVSVDIRPLLSTYFPPKGVPPAGVGERRVGLKDLALVSRVNMIHDGNCMLEALTYAYLLHSGRPIVVMDGGAQASVLQVSERWYNSHRGFFSEVRELAAKCWALLEELKQLSPRSKLIPLLFPVLFNDVEEGEVEFPDLANPSLADIRRCKERLTNNSPMSANGFMQLVWKSLGLGYTFAHQGSDGKLLEIVSDTDPLDNEHSLRLFNAPTSLDDGSSLQVLPIHHNRALYDLFVRRLPVSL